VGGSRRKIKGSPKLGRNMSCPREKTTWAVAQGSTRYRRVIAARRRDIKGSKTEKRLQGYAYTLHRQKNAPKGEKGGEGDAGHAAVILRIYKNAGLCAGAPKGERRNRCHSIEENLRELGKGSMIGSRSGERTRWTSLGGALLKKSEKKNPVIKGGQVRRGTADPYLRAFTIQGRGEGGVEHEAFRAPTGKKAAHWRDLGKRGNKKEDEL